MPRHQLAEYNSGEETAMKWSQAICASILVDEFYLLSLHARSNSRSGRLCPMSPWNLHSDRTSSQRTGGFPQGRSAPGPRNRKPMRHDAPDEAGAYVLNLSPQSVKLSRSRVSLDGRSRLLGADAG